MPAKEIANANMTIQVKSPVVGTVTVISQPSTDVKAGGAGIYSGPLKFSVANIVNDPCGKATVGTLSQGVIEPTAVDTKAGGKLVIRKGDKVENLQSTGAMQPGGSGPEPCVITFAVEIVDAGQSDIKGS
jgi:hypothetical protein